MARERETLAHEREVQKRKEAQDRSELEVAHATELQSVQARLQAALQAQTVAETELARVQQELASHIERHRDVDGELAAERTRSHEQGAELARLLKQRDELMQEHDAHVTSLERKSAEKYERLLRESKDIRERADQSVLDATSKLQASLARIQELEAEVQGGSGPERTMMQLAAQQASRDQERHALEMELADLRDRIGELEEVVRKQEQQKRFLHAQIGSLQRSIRRSNVDVEYVLSRLQSDLQPLK